MAAGFGVGVDRARGVARCDRGTEGAGRVLRLPPVMGDLDEPGGGRDPGADRSLFDRPGIGRMQDPALRRQQPVVGSLLHERMSESIAFDRPVLITNRS